MVPVYKLGAELRMSSKVPIHVMPGVELSSERRIMQARRVMMVSRPIEQHHSATMSSGNKRKFIKYAEVPLLKWAAIIGPWWYSKGSGQDGRQH